MIGRRYDNVTPSIVVIRSEQVWTNARWLESTRRAAGGDGHESYRIER